MVSILKSCVVLDNRLITTNEAPVNANANVHVNVKLIAGVPIVKRDHLYGCRGGHFTKRDHLYVC